MVMSDGVNFTLSGKAVPQGSMRNIGVGRPLVHANKHLLAWREQVAWTAKAALPRSWGMAGPFAVDVTFYLPRPRSTPATTLLPIAHKNDLDKLVRAILDALSKIAYDDDGQVTDLHVRKRFGDPRIEVSVEHLIGG